jgi:hypothetical protein
MLFNISPAWTTDTTVALRFRLLRKIAEETKNHDLERDLYIEERKAERGMLMHQYLQSGPWHAWVSNTLALYLWMYIMILYGLLADYGRSLIRPLVALVGSIFVFHAAYTLAALPSESFPAPLLDKAWVVIKAMVPKDASPADRAVTAFAIANAVPFVGALTLDREVKTMVLCGRGSAELAAVDQHPAPTCSAVPQLSIQLLILAQSIFSALCFFLIALVLRNYFKVR